MMVNDYMISVAPQPNNQVAGKLNANNSVPRRSVAKQDTRIEPLKALAFGTAGTLLGGPAEGLSLGLGMAVLDKTGGTRFLDKTFDKLGLDKLVGDLGEKSGLFKFVNVASEKLGLYTEGKVPFANDVKGLFSELITTDTQQAKLDTDNELYFEDKKKYPAIAKKVNGLVEKILTGDHSAFKASYGQPNGDTFQFDVKSSKVIDIPPPIRNGNASWEVYQAIDELAMKNARAYMMTRSSKSDGAVRITRLTDSNKQTISIFSEGKDTNSLKPTAIHIFKEHEHAQKLAA